jgi:glycosyltransferase involved in cell wall biosynthesis
MKIVIDARWIGPTPSGVGVYTVELLKRLPALASDWHFHLLFDDDDLRLRVLEECGLAQNDMVLSETLPYGVFSPEGQLRLPRRLRAIRADLFHSPNYMIPYLAFKPGPGGRGCGRCITTIHDVIPLLFRDHAPQSRKSRMLPLFRYCLRQSVLRSDAVLTVSRTSRDDIVRALGLAGAEAAKIEAVYNGVDERFVPTTVQVPTRSMRTILYVGRLDPYKQVVTLVRAFGQLLRQKKEEPLHLLIVGPDDPRYPEARQVTSALGLDDHVTFLGFLSNRELVSIYQESALLVNPSCYEGFGLQLIEAMRCGVPVVCCDGGAQPEIAAQAARIVAAGDTQALTDAMLGVLGDAVLRTRMVTAGLSRAKDFDWQKTARETLAVYRRVLAGESAGG